MLLIHGLDKHSGYLSLHFSLSDFCWRVSFHNWFYALGKFHDYLKVLALKLLAKIKLKETDADLLPVFSLHQLELLFLPDFSL